MSFCILRWISTWSFSSSFWRISTKGSLAPPDSNSGASWSNVSAICCATAASTISGGICGIGSPAIWDFCTACLKTSSTISLANNETCSCIWACNKSSACGLVLNAADCKKEACTRMCARWSCSLNACVGIPFIKPAFSVAGSFGAGGCGAGKIESMFFTSNASYIRR